jgi:hypothetical protein
MYKKTKSYPRFLATGVALMISLTVFSAIVLALRSEKAKFVPSQFVGSKNAGELTS